ncbi:hypothetical protein [Arthrobacter sp. NIO-1057]|uniref:hypothetical protein n=1 Tax=Arthrobacter sp. NIO-1057 TaxID=993071 RepID=UPI00071C38B4|nr:hypothetical protein [Arthrobacter sp. NIO-1057]KSU67228.1 hypothetical protein AS038_05550 [Arthrobacter sp. NIO-1057]
MKYPPATRVDHEKFCLTEQWTRRKTSTGKTGTQHHNYELGLPDGRVLLTRISHPINREDYGVALWNHILRGQLEVTNEDFWNCVKSKILPDRGFAQKDVANAIPSDVVNILVNKFHVAEQEVRRITAIEAVTLMSNLFAEEISKRTDNSGQ